MANTIKEKFSSLGDWVKDIWNDKKNRPVSLKEFTSVCRHFYFKGANNVLDDLKDLIDRHENYGTDVSCHALKEFINKLKT